MVSSYYIAYMGVLYFMNSVYMVNVNEGHKKQAHRQLFKSRDGVMVGDGLWG
jgi:hypothetical protein